MYRVRLKNLTLYKRTPPRKCLSEGYSYVVPSVSFPPEWNAEGRRTRFYCGVLFSDWWSLRTHFKISPNKQVPSGHREMRWTNPCTLQSPKVTLRMRLASFGVIGPYFFDATVDTKRYKLMITHFQRKLASIWFQQDDATCHTGALCMWLLFMGLLEVAHLRRSAGRLETSQPQG